MNMMRSPMAPNLNAPFKPTTHQQAVATLLLIENSQAMLAMWPNLRDRYLQNIVMKLESTNPMVPITTLMLESMPAPNEGLPEVPRQYDALQNGLYDFRFNYDPQNRLSVGKVWSGAEFLASTKFQGQPAARHLIIVAASTPLDDAFGINMSAYPGQTVWHRLARKLTQADIQCHMVLCSNQDMSPFMTLFDETLRLQNSVEEPPSFPIDRHILFRLSARAPSFNSLYSDTAHRPANPPQAHRALPSRSRSFPLGSYLAAQLPKDNGLTVASSTSELAPDPPPSLVSQLQQVHGLTKKKVYGSKPARKSFFREERVQKEPLAVPTPLILPAAIQTSPLDSAGGRAVSRSRAGRILRAAQASPTELTSRRPFLPRRGSRVSSPETEGLPNALPSALSSPVSPSSMSSIYLHSSPVASQQPDLPSDASWQPYPPIVPSHSIVPSHVQPQYSAYQQNPQPAVPSNYMAGNGADYSQQSTSGRQSTELSHTPIALDNSHHESRANSQVHGVANGIDESHLNGRLPRRASCPEDEEPFTFNAEYVAATAALFKREVLPAYPQLAALEDITQPPYAEPISPRHAFFIAQDQNSMPPSPTSSYNPGELYVGANQRDEMLLHSASLEYPPVPATDSPGLAYATSYSPGSSSSLTGWAG